MNRNLCGTVLSQGGTLVPLLISAKDSGGLGLMNPSVFIDDDNILVNIRNINYVLYHSEGDQLFSNRWGPLAYLNPENDMKLKTTNFIGILDENFNIKKYFKVDTSKLDSPKPLWEFHGLEDARLVKWNDRLYLSGVRRDTTENGQGRIELSEIKINKTSVLEIHRTRIEPPTQSYCEKNWMPILDMPFHYVKWTNPTEVVKVDGTKSETIYLGINIIPDMPDFRGGSQVVNYGENRICLVHQVNLFKNRLQQKDAVYEHRFIVWDKDWNIIKISEPFSFLGGQIEFCCGMAFHYGDMLVTFGFQDNSAFLLKIPNKMINSLIYGE
jgi:hypothetical protein